jgi:hypothetical protein
MHHDTEPHVDPQLARMFLTKIIGSMTSAINGFAELEILAQWDKPVAILDESESDLEHTLAHPRELLPQLTDRSIVE